MAVPPTTPVATQGDGKPRINKQDLSSTSNQDLGQGFNKSNSTVHSMGLSNPDINPGNFGRKPSPSMLTANGLLVVFAS